MKKVVPIIIAVLLVLFLVFGIVFMTDSHDDSVVCQGIELSVHDGQKDEMVTMKAVQEMLKEKWIDPTGKTLDKVLLDSMEHVLVRHPYIETAQCFITSGHYVRICVTTKVPLVRVHNSRGQDFYVDSHGGILPCRSTAVHLPVATGYIDHAFASGPLLDVVNAINASEFWKAQIEQINVTAKGCFELVPRVGYHLLELGPDEDIPEKLDRLFRFYEKGLDKVGWNKYSRISVAYKGQVVCRKRQ